MGEYLNENSVLMGEQLSESCQNMAEALRKDIEAYEIVKKRLKEFAECQSTGATIHGLIMQLDDICLALDSLIAANYSDICDLASTYIHCRGAGIIVGQVVIEGEKAALAEEQFDNEMGDWWTRAANEAEWYEVVYEALCRRKARQFYADARADRELYNAWNAKREKYNTTYENTEQYVTGSKNIRIAAMEFMSVLLSTFNGSTYDSSLGEACRANLMNANIERVITYLDDGTAVVNWREVEKITSKDATQITDVEYEALTVAYLNMSDSELERFIELLMVDREEVNYNFIEELLGSSSIDGSSFHKVDHVEWRIDDEKVNQIKARLSCQEDAYLILERQLDAYGLTEEANSICESRCILLQRYVLLDEMNNVNTFRTAIDGNREDILSVTNVDGNYVATFKQYGDLLDGPTHCYHSLAEGTITISETHLAASARYEQLDYIEAGMISRFGVPSNSDIVIDGITFGAKETGSQVADYQISVLQNMAQSAGKKGLSRGIGAIPVVGDVVSFGLESVMDYEQAKEDTQYIVEQFDMGRAQLVYSDLDCNTVFVERDMYNDHSLTAIPMAGEDTAERLEAINTAFNLNLTLEFVFENPKETIEQIETVRNEQEYDDIIKGR